MLTVEWTDKAKLSLEVIQEYIVPKFGDNKFNQILDLIDDSVVTISKGRVKFKYSKKHDCYKMVYHKNGSLYYKFEKDNILKILYVWDNRMMKGKNKFE